MARRLQSPAMRRLVFLAFLVGAPACTSSATVPLGWQTGGAPLWVPRATWMTGTATVDLLPDGKVFVNGTETFGIDAAGRVFDKDGDAIGLLSPDGRLVGANQEILGQVGPVSAAPPGTTHATFAIAPTGEVRQYEDNGDSTTRGVWSGCGLYAQSLQACMLVTYMVMTKYPPSSGWRSVNPWSPWNGYGAPMYPFGVPSP